MLTVFFVVCFEIHINPFCNLFPTIKFAHTPLHSFHLNSPVFHLYPPFVKCLLLLRCVIMFKNSLRWFSLYTFCATTIAKDDLLIQVSSQIEVSLHSREPSLCPTLSTTIYLSIFAQCSDSWDWFHSTHDKICLEVILTRHVS